MKIKVELDGGIRLLWPTPVLQKVYPGAEDLNPRLGAIIRLRTLLLAPFILGILGDRRQEGHRH